MLNADMEAINKYIMETNGKSSKAESIKAEWIRYWESIKRDWSWYSQEEFDKARNFRDRFNLANVTSKAEETAVKEQMRSGVSAERARGETERRTSSGSYLEEEKPLVDFNIPLSWKIGAGVSALVLGLLWIASKTVAFDPIKISANALLARRK